MFKITPNPTFNVPVELTVPGESTKGSIEVTFKYLNKQAFDEWQKKHHKNPHETSLKDVVVNWSGVSDENGTEIPYSPDALERLCGNYFLASKEIVQTFIAETIGARIKN